MITVLLIDDTAEELVRPLRHRLKNDFSLEICDDPEEALAAVAATKPDLVLLDLHFPDDAMPTAPTMANKTTGFRLLAEIRRQHPKTPVLIFTGVLEQREIPLDIFEIQPHGQYSKPDFREEGWAVGLKQAMHNAIDAAEALGDLVEGLEESGYVVGQTQAMEQAARMIRLAASNTRSSVTIYGDEGTGRMHTAQVIHQLSECTGKFVLFNCDDREASLPEKLKQAKNGVLYLRDIQFLQHQQLEILVKCPDNVRLISSTAYSYNDILSDKHLTSGLVDRLHEDVISLPLLKDRLDDIDSLFQHALQRANTKRKPAKQIQETLEPAVKELLRNRKWRSNIREFNNTINQAAMTAAAHEDTLLRERYIPPEDESAQTAVNNDVVALIGEYDAAKLRQHDAARPHQYQFLLDLQNPQRGDLLIEIIRRLANELGRRPRHGDIANEIFPVDNRERSEVVFRRDDTVRQFVCTTLRERNTALTTLFEPIKKKKGRKEH